MKMGSVAIRVEQLALVVVTRQRFKRTSWTVVRNRKDRWRRTVRKADGTIESQTTFTFDTAANGLGRLASESITGTYEGWQGLTAMGLSFSRSHAYDDFGRPYSATTVVDGV